MVQARHRTTGRGGPRATKDRGSLTRSPGANLTPSADQPRSSAHAAHRARVIPRDGAVARKKTSPRREPG